MQAGSKDESSYLQVESQGEMIQRIEYHIDLAGDHVYEGVRETIEAYQYDSKRRRRRVMALTCCLSIICVIAIMFMGSEYAFGFW